MKYIVTHRLSSFLIIPEGEQLEIDGFIFLRDINGNNSATSIQTEVEAHTREEAQIIARKRIAQFLSKITILHDAKYTLLEFISVTDGKTTLVNRSIQGRANIGMPSRMLWNNG